MTTLRRTATLLTIALAVLLGLTAPANATFTDKTTTNLASIGTLALDAPATPRTGPTRCSTTTWYSNVNGQVSSGTTTTLRAQLSWDASTSPRVTSYLITTHGQGWSTKVTEVPASVLSVSASFDGTTTDQNLTVTITARTDYGWTAESPRSGVIKC